MLLLVGQIDELLPVSSASFNVWRAYIGPELPADGKAWREMFDGPQDFITTQSKQVHGPFERIIHTQNWVFTRVC